MDRDTGKPDREDEARQDDTGMIGSDSEQPGPGRDTSLTETDPVAGETEQPRSTVAMSEGDPMRTRLGSHVEGAGLIGYDVAAAEEGATQETPAGDRPGYEAERPDAPATAYERDSGLAAEPVVDQGDLGREREPGLAAEPAVDQGSYGQDPGYAGGGERVEDAGPSDSSVFADAPPAPERSAFATEDAGAADYAAVADDPPQESLYDQEADRAREQRPSDS